MKMGNEKEVYTNFKRSDSYEELSQRLGTGFDGIKNIQRGQVLNGKGLASGN